MKKIIVLLCLVLAGCTTISSVNNIPPQTVKREPIVAVDQNELDDIIAVFSQAIKNNPDYAGA